MAGSSRAGSHEAEVKMSVGAVFPSGGQGPLQVHHGLWADPVPWRTSAGSHAQPLVATLQTSLRGPGVLKPSKRELWVPKAQRFEALGLHDGLPHFFSF